MPTNKQRREAERRRLARQAERRRNQHDRDRRTNLIVSILGTIVVAAIILVFIIATNADDGSTPATTATTARPTPSSPARPASSATSRAPRSPSTSATAPAHSATTTAAVRTVRCTYTRGAKAARAVDLPDPAAPAAGRASVAVDTSEGLLSFSLDRRTAPCATQSFVSLAEQGYFDATPCHRLVTKTIFVVQCGDPTGTGRGGPGYTFADELTGRAVYRRGVLAMANAGADANGSQFFIAYRRSDLGPRYTIFGRVTSGLATIDTVAAAGTADGSTDGRPKLALTIRTVTVG